jgi:hypothetical protein
VALVLFFAVLCTPGAQASMSAQEQPAVESLRGRLATVEPTNRRLTILPDGEVKLLELFVGDDGELRQDDRPVTLAELVIQVGRRVTVDYRLDGTRRVVERLIVEPD